MSELTPCNRCNLERMQRRAAILRVDLIVEVVPDGNELAGWTSVRYGHEPEPCAYFLELPDECACD